MFSLTDGLRCMTSTSGCRFLRTALPRGARLINSNSHLQPGTIAYFLPLIPCAEANEHPRVGRNSVCTADPSGRTSSRPPRATVIRRVVAARESVIFLHGDHKRLSRTPVVAKHPGTPAHYLLKLAVSADVRAGSRFVSSRLQPDSNSPHEAWTM